MAPGRASNSKRKRSSIPDPHEATSTPPKRRRKSTTDGSSSKRKAAAPVQPADLSQDKGEDFYDARAILEEKGNKYLIDWADNKVTGESYDPTWEPKKNANYLLVEEWKRKKQERKNSKQPKPAPAAAPSPAPSHAEAAAPHTHSSPAPASPTTSTPKRDPHVPKRRRVIDSSSPEPVSEPNQLPDPSSAPDSDSPVVPETGGRDTRPRVEPEVVVTQPFNLNFSDYELFTASQVQSHESSSSQLQPSRLTADSPREHVSSQPGPESYNIPAEELLRQPRFGNGIVIPDSQSLHGDSSYAPSTQTVSGAESQPAQAQSQLPEPADTSAPQESSASVSAQFTNPHNDDSSAPVPETDPIEDPPSSPATHSHHEEEIAPQHESPSQTASSASSPPPTDSPDKSTQAESRVDNTQISAEAAGGTRSLVENEQAREPDVETFSRSLSPKSRPEEQRQPSPEGQEPQETTVEDQLTEDPEAGEGDIGRNLAGSEGEAEAQSGQVLVLQSGTIDEPQFEQPVPELEGEVSEGDQQEPGLEQEVVEEDHHEPELPEEVVEKDQGEPELEKEGGEVDQCEPEPEEQGIGKDQHAPQPEPEESPVSEAVTPAQRTPKSYEGAAIEGVPVDQRGPEPEESTVVEAEPVNQGSIIPEEEAVAEAGSAGYHAPGPQDGDAAQPAPATVESVQSNRKELVEAEHTGHHQDLAGSETHSTRYSEAQHPVPYFETPPDRVIEFPNELTRGATSPLQDQAEISTQDITDPLETDSHLQFAQRDYPCNNDLSSPTSKEPTEPSAPEHPHNRLQSTRFAPELDLDELQAGYRTQASNPTNSYQADGFGHTKSPKRKDSSQDSVDPSVLGQADPNVVRHAYDPSPKDIVLSVEDRAESPLRGYYRKPSRGMPRAPQTPIGFTGGHDLVAPDGWLTDQLREINSRTKAESERRKAELLAQFDEAHKPPIPKSPSLETSTRSPSVIPPNGAQTAMEPQYTLIPSNLSAETRPHESQLPNAQNNHSMPDIHHPDDDTEMHDSTPGVLLEDPVIGEAEYLVGLSMEGLQGDQYRSEFKFKEHAITRFLEDDSPEETQFQEMRELLRRMDNIVTHMDLGFEGADALTQYEDNNMDERGMVAWSTSSSTKFRFLGGILDRLRHKRFHFVIMGRQGAMIDIIEKFVSGMEIQYSRGGHVDRELFEARESIFVTILASDLDGVDTSIPSADLIIAMDSTVQCHDSKIKSLRNHLRGSSDSIPVITPMVPYSIEHVERCVSASVQGLVRERLLVRFMTELRQLAGRIDVSTKVKQAVDFIVPSIETDLEHHEAWPLHRINSIKGEVRFDESMVSSSSVPVGTLSPSAASRQKRPLDVEERSTKRTRLTPQPDSDTVNPNDITHISNSVPGGTLPPALSSNPHVDENLRAYRKDERLRSELKQTKQRLREFEDALEACQTEKEEQKDLILQLKRENTELKQAQLNVSGRVRTQNDKMADLSNERDALAEQLAEARALLANSTVPEVAEREQLRRERDDALAQLKRVQKQRESQSNESEFFRSQYQDASNNAAAMGERIASLTQQVRELEHLKTGEHDRARRLSLSHATEAYREEVEQLTLQLRESNASLQQKTDELKAIKGSRGVGTRAGSVPRSPRITGGPGSRSGSPAPSGLGGHGRLGALRNINA